MWGYFTTSGIIFSHERNYGWTCGVMVTAERDGKFVADLASERSRLGKFEVVGVAGRALADNTGLGRNEGEVGFVPPDTVVNAEVFHQAREPFAMFDDLMHMAQHRRMILLREISVRREFAKRAKRSSDTGSRFGRWKLKLSRPDCTPRVNVPQLGIELCKTGPWFFNDLKRLLPKWQADITKKGPPPRVVPFIEFFRFVGPRRGGKPDFPCADRP
jgi:hypothetical protein